MQCSTKTFSAEYLLFSIISTELVLLCVEDGSGKPVQTICVRLRNLGLQDVKGVILFFKQICVILISHWKSLSSLLVTHILSSGQHFTNVATFVE